VATADACDGDVDQRCVAVRVREHARGWDVLRELLRKTASQTEVLDSAIPLNLASGRSANTTDTLLDDARRHRSVRDTHTTRIRDRPLVHGGVDNARRTRDD
jgi:hypothetical protein